MKTTTVEQWLDLAFEDTRRSSPYHLVQQDARRALWKTEGLAEQVEAAGWIESRCIVHCEHSDHVTGWVGAPCQHQPGSFPGADLDAIRSAIAGDSDPSVLRFWCDGCLAEVYGPRDDELLEQDPDELDGRPGDVDLVYRYTDQWWAERERRLKPFQEAEEARRQAAARERVEARRQADAERLRHGLATMGLSATDDQIEVAVRRWEER